MSLLWITLAAAAGFIFGWRLGLSLATQRLVAVVIAHEPEFKDEDAD